MEEPTCAVLWQWQTWQRSCTNFFKEHDLVFKGTPVCYHLWNAVLVHRKATNQSTFKKSSYNILVSSISSFSMLWQGVEALRKGLLNCKKPRILKELCRRHNKSSARVFEEAGKRSSLTWCRAPQKKLLHVFGLALYLSSSKTLQQIPKFKHNIQITTEGYLKNQLKPSERLFEKYNKTKPRHC